MGGRLFPAPKALNVEAVRDYLFLPGLSVFVGILGLRATIFLWTAMWPRVSVSVPFSSVSVSLSVQRWVLPVRGSPQAPSLSI